MISARHGIASLNELQVHLQYAIGLELTTVPAYLCALYSINPDTNSAAREAIQSVVVEEMLHMAVAANVLNAIGGTPSPNPVNGGASPVPVYPARVPYIKGIPTIHLQKFSPLALNDFIDIEHPGGRRRRQWSLRKQYVSIGAFYEAIEQGLREHCKSDVFARARRERRDCQVPGHEYYGGAGLLTEVTDLQSALDALSLIRDQGEGLPREALKCKARDDKLTGLNNPRRVAALGPAVSNDDKLAVDEQSVADGEVLRDGWKMYSHYARFMEIRYGKRYWPDQTINQKPVGATLPTDWDAVRPMIKNPHADNYRDTYAHRPMVACNRTYTSLVDATYEGFNGKHNRLRDAVGLMYDLKYQAAALLNTPSPFDPNQTLGPAFEYDARQNNPAH